MDKRRDFWEGCRDCLPLMVGGVPVGLLCGMMSQAAGFTPTEAVLMSVLVFSGAAQFVAASMTIAGPVFPGLVIIGAMLVNLHNLLLGASLAPHMTRLPAGLRWLLAATITDGTYAITMKRILRDGYSGAYHLGASVVMFVFWVAANATGAVAGEYLPNPLAWGLDFTITAVFIAILVPLLTNRVSVLVAAVAASVALAGAAVLPGKWYLLLACGAAMVTGVALERRMSGEG